MLGARPWSAHARMAMETQPIRVMLLDDHRSVLLPLAFMLDQEPDLTVVARASSLAEARRHLAAPAIVDVAIVDLHLTDGSGTDLIRELRTANPEASAIVLTGTASPQACALAIEAGAVGVLDKLTADHTDIAIAIRRARAGEPLVPPAELTALVREGRRLREQERAARTVLAGLTPRELEILQALADGLGDKAIAERFSISDRTVRNHVVNLLDKLGVDSRMQALILAARLGAITLHGPEWRTR
jgi:DNA-binding NarL/FixJ family response regulator